MRGAIAAAIASGALVGCSAVALATGTDEEDIVHVGSTKDSISGKLGEPLRIEDLGPPIRIWDVRGRSPPLHLLIWPHQAAGPDGKIRLEAPTDEATTKVYFRFVGRLKLQHDVGEAIAVNLMTLGMAELLMTPAAIAERSEKKEHLLIAWLDRSGKAIAYEWGRIQQLP